MNTKDAELGRDVAMHITAINPMVIRSEEISEETLEKEREIYTSQAQESGKPADIVEKMVEGRIKKFLSEVSLVDQPFVKEPDRKVGDLLNSANSEVISFYRLEVGEGIEIEEEDFAAEVAAQLKGSQ
jgi:elongation factor Ts